MSALETALSQALDDNGLDESFRSTIRDMVQDTNESNWPECCGSSCDPCVMIMHAAARRARALLKTQQGS